MLNSAIGIASNFMQNSLIS